MKNKEEKIWALVWLIVVIGLLWLAGESANECMGQGYQQPDPRCIQAFTPQGQQGQQQYGSTIPYTQIQNLPPSSAQYPPASSQYSPAVVSPSQSVSGPSGIQVETREPECQASTVWIVGVSTDNEKHFYMSGCVIGKDDSRGERRLLILTEILGSCNKACAGCGNRFKLLVGFKGESKGYWATELVVDGLRLIEITSSKRPSPIMPFATSWAEPQDEVIRDGFSPVDEGNPTLDREQIHKVRPKADRGTVRGYRKSLIVVNMELREGFAGSPIYSQDGLQGITIMAARGGDGCATGISSLAILNWLDKSRVRLSGDTYTLLSEPFVETVTEPYADENGILPKWKDEAEKCCPSTVLPGPAPDDSTDAPLPPTVDPAIPPVDIDIPIPGEDSEDSTEVPEESDDEMGMLLEELAKNMVELTANTNKIMVSVDDLTTRVDGLEMGYDALEKKCKDGTSCDPNAVADVLKNDEDFLVKVAELVVCPPLPVPSSKAHLVLVRDTGGDYWPRMSGELEKAKSLFSGIREVDPPQFATALPRLIGYVNGVPVLDVSGVRNVSDSLVAIARGEFSFPRKER